MIHLNVNFTHLNSVFLTLINQMFYSFYQSTHCVACIISPCIVFTLKHETLLRFQDQCCCLSLHTLLAFTVRYLFFPPCTFFLNMDYKRLTFSLLHYCSMFQSLNLNNTNKTVFLSVSISDLSVPFKEALLAQGIVRCHPFLWWRMVQCILCWRR